MTVYPPARSVFTFTRLCEVKDVKVVILGQDPYHGPKQAHGLCFSVPKNVARPPRFLIFVSFFLTQLYFFWFSLENIFKELKSDIPDFKIPNHGTLTGWAKQGILLLNSCLTVEKNRANSHKDKGWELFTVYFRYVRLIVHSNPLFLF